MRDLRFLRLGLVVSALVLEMALLTIGGLLAGAWLDRKFGTTPILLAVLTFAGFIGGILRISRVLGASSDPHDPPPDDPD